MNEVYNEQMFTVSAKDEDPIEALVRRGAKVMPQAALEQEVSEYLARAPSAQRTGVGVSRRPKRSRTGAQAHDWQWHDQGQAASGL